MKKKIFDKLKKDFDSYFQSFAESDGKIHPLQTLKYIHSINVAKEAKLIATSMKWPEKDIHTAEIIGLYHDIGRFQQFRDYQTFADRKSVNHAKLGSFILVKDKILEKLPKDEKKIISTAVAFHNCKKIPEKLSREQLKFMKLIRDADKLDIFRVVLENLRKDGFKDLLEMFPEISLKRSPSQDVVTEFIESKVCSIGKLKNIGDFLLMQIAWMHDMNYEPSSKQLKKRGIIKELISYLDIAGTEYATLKEKLKDYAKSARKTEASKKTK